MNESVSLDIGQWSDESKGTKKNKEPVNMSHLIEVLIKL